MGTRENVFMFPHVEALAETTTEADLLANSTAYIAHLTADQKDRLLSSLMACVYGPMAYRRVEGDLHYKQVVQAVQDEFTLMAGEVLGI